MFQKTLKYNKNYLIETTFNSIELNNVCYTSAISIKATFMYIILNT